MPWMQRYTNHLGCETTSTCSTSDLCFRLIDRVDQGWSKLFWVSYATMAIVADHNLAICHHSASLDRLSFCCHVYIYRQVCCFVVLGGWSSTRELYGIQVQQLLVLATLISSWFTIGKFATLAHKKARKDEVTPKLGCTVQPIIFVGLTATICGLNFCRSRPRHIHMYNRLTEKGPFVAILIKGTSR